MRFARRLFLAVVGGVLLLSWYPLIAWTYNRWSWFLGLACGLAGALCIGAALGMSLGRSDHDGKPETLSPPRR